MRASRFSLSCSGLVAPRSTVETLGFFAAQARARVAREQPSLSAMGLSLRVRSTLATISGSLNFSSACKDCVRGGGACADGGVTHVAKELGLRGVARVLGDTVVVLAREYTRSERRPDGCAVLVVVEEGGVLVLEAVAAQHRVLRLLSTWRDQVEARSNGVSLLNLSGRPFARSPAVIATGQRRALDRVCSDPLKCLALLDEVVEAANSLFHGRAEIRAVGEDDVDVVHLEALKRVVHPLNKVFATHAPAVRAFTATAKEDLGDDDQLAAFPL